MEDKIINWREVCGTEIHLIMDADNDFKSTKTHIKYRSVPTEDYLFNFNIKAGNHNLFILDPYGDEIISDNLRKRIFYNRNLTTAIDKRTGIIYTAAFWFDGHLRKMVISSDFGRNQLIVPKSYRRYLSNLLSQKRPYYWTINSSALVQFIEKEEGFSHLRDNISIVLDIGKDKRRCIEISSFGGESCCREIGDWK